MPPTRNLITWRSSVGGARTGPPVYSSNSGRNVRTIKVKVARTRPDFAFTRRAFHQEYSIKDIVRRRAYVLTGPRTLLNPAHPNPEIISSEVRAFIASWSRQQLLPARPPKMLWVHMHACEIFNFSSVSSFSRQSHESLLAMCHNPTSSLGTQNFPGGKGTINNWLLIVNLVCPLQGSLLVSFPLSFWVRSAEVFSCM